ncbi:MAG: SoxXA-binding protein [Gammaproteobacteria bacterium]|nr:SoxXA-binding protein [Gammaproteobacteria bacterium]
MKKFVPLFIAAALVLGACGAQQKHTDKDAAAAISAAKSVNKKAKKAEFEWRDTGKIIKKAEAAAKDGEFDEAVKQANKAKKQAEMALQQAKAAKRARPRI